MKSGTCPRCESTKIVPADEIRAGKYGFAVLVHAEPQNAFMKGSFESAIEALVCGGCGLIEFYARSAPSLYSVYRRSGRGVDVAPDGGE